MFGLFQSRCQICNTHFSRTKYKWQIRGRKAWVCPACNAALKKRVSAAAFGSEVEFPEVRKRGGCGLLGCLGILFLPLIAIGLISDLISDRASTSTSPTKSVTDSPVPSGPKASNLPSAAGGAPVPSVVAAKNRTASKVPLFNTPLDAARIPFGLGLSDTASGKAPWREGELGWYGLAKIVTHKGALSRVGDIDNDITCMHSSLSPGIIEYVRWTANHFNSDDKSTPARFRELCLAYARKLGCKIPDTLFLKVDPAKGQVIDTPEAIFKLERLAYKIGYGWQFTITGKNENDN